MKIPVLDHGYVQFIEAWGGGVYGADTLNSEVRDYEAGVVEAARQSTQGSFRGWEKDDKLLRHLFLSEPPHASPFEFSGMVIEVQAPIFVFREWVRHRSASYNEMSARYAPLPNLHYLPEAAQCMPAGDGNKQAGSAIARVPSVDEVQDWIAELEALYLESERVYQMGLRMGILKQEARLSNVVARYSKMRASANLRNWLAFLTLRLDSRAQWEIQQYAQAVGQIIQRKFPHVWKLFAEKSSRAPS